MYSSKDIQDIITRLNGDKELKTEFISRVCKYCNNSDSLAIKDVLSDGCYERFDRYDSDVCEQFLTVWEKGVIC